MKKLNPKPVTLFTENIEDELKVDFDFNFQFILPKQKTIEVYIPKKKKVKGLF